MEQIESPKHNDLFRSYGFIEYDSVQAAKDAISSMNLFDLGGKLTIAGTNSHGVDLSFVQVNICE